MDTMSEREHVLPRLARGGTLPVSAVRMETVLKAAVSEGDVELENENVSMERWVEHEGRVPYGALEVASDARMATVGVLEEQGEGAKSTTPINTSREGAVDGIRKTAAVMVPRRGGDVSVRGSKFRRHFELIEV